MNPSPGLDMNALVGQADIFFITLDSLRWDVLRDAPPAALAAGWAPVWEERHSPASFTYAAHHAFFAGFLPTPARPGRHPRLFASAFGGSETTTARTFTFDEPDLPGALAARGYRTICIGGVGFFNRRTALGRTLPDLFQEAHWRPALGVTSRRSTEFQVDLAIERLRATPPEASLDGMGLRFLFINVSATHHPTHIHHPSLRHDSPATQAAALAHADIHLARLLRWQQHEQKRRTVVILTSDHGHAFGEEGYAGHRLGHPSVWTVPYTEFLLDPR